MCILPIRAGFLIIGSLWIVSVPSSQMSCLDIRLQVMLVTPM